MHVLDPVLLTIIAFGAITSYTDIKLGKIKNTHIILLLITGLIVNIFITNTLLSSPLQTVVNSSIALLIGFTMWCMGLLSTGDAKLFLGFSLLLPITAYKHGYIQYFPSFVILINTFVPVALFFIVASLFRLRVKAFKTEVKRVLNPSSLLNTVLYLIGFSYVVRLVFSYLNLSMNMFLHTLILFVLMKAIRRVKIVSFTTISVVLALMRLVLSFQSVLTLSFLKEILMLVLIFQGFMILMSYLVNVSFTEKVKIEDLKPGMMLGERLVKRGEGYAKKQLSFINLFGVFEIIKDSILSDIDMKLTEENIKKLQLLHKKKKLKFDTINIANTVPFAPFMFLGVLMTYVLQGNSLIHFITLKDYFLMYLRIFFYRVIT